jgi:hypothetical protein
MKHGRPAAVPIVAASNTGFHEYSSYVDSTSLLFLNTGTKGFLQRLYNAVGSTSILVFLP